MIRSVRLIPSLGSVLLLGACAHTISLVVPADQEAHFQACMGNPSVSWKHSSGGGGGIGASIGGDAAPATASFPRTLNLGTESTFRNVFRAGGARTGGGISASSTQDAGPANEPAAAAVDRTKAILDDLDKTNVGKLYEGLSSAASGNGNQEVNLDGRQIRELSDRLNSSVVLGDWSRHRESAKQVLDTLTTGPAASSSTLADRGKALKDYAVAVYIETYMKAYFRNGKFAEATVDLSGVPGELSNLASLNAAERLSLDSLLKKASGPKTFGKVAEMGFVTRSGTTYQFPALSFNLDPIKKTHSSTDVDYTVVGTNLIRVLIEAIFDALDQIPAVAKATGVTVANQPGRESVALADFKKIAAAVPDFRLPTDDEFGEIDAFANQAEAAAGVVLGRVMRGFGPVAMNNEPVAKLLETTVGAITRKVSEKLAWCWYSLPKNANESGPAASVSNPGSGAAERSATTIRVNVKY